MAVVASSTFSHCAEAEIAHTQTNKTTLRRDGCHDVLRPPCGQSQCIALFICITTTTTISIIINIIMIIIIIVIQSLITL